jgi:Exonuclease VII small subunit.
MSNEINKKMAEIDEILIKIESGEIPLEEVFEKYKEAISKAAKLEEELDSLKNEIQILSKNFAQEE